MAMAALVATAAAAQGRVFVTAQGVSLEAPPVAQMDCDAMDRVLGAIDRSGYRAGALPRDPADFALRQYEDRLWSRHYAQCLHPPSVTADPQTAFEVGYDEQDPAR